MTRSKLKRRQTVAKYQVVVRAGLLRVIDPRSVQKNDQRI
jgi:hypothetical protein